MTDTLTVKRSELAATVAEVVMGWAASNSGLTWNDNEGIAARRMPSYGTVHRPWDPTADANEMLAVVERLRELGWEWSAETVADAFLSEFSKVDRYPCYHDDSLGVTTCLAAIEAVTGKPVVLED